MKINFMDKTGHTEIDVEMDFDLAKTLFDEAIASGKMAFATAVRGGNVAITSLDEAIEMQAETVTFIPAYAGG